MVTGIDSFKDDSKGMKNNMPSSEERRVTF